SALGHLPLPRPSTAGPPVDPVLHLPRRRGWPPRGGATQRQLLGARWLVGGDDRLVRHEDVVLAAAFYLLERDGRRRRHRRDQFTGQPRRPDRAQPGWLAQGQYRPLPGSHYPPRHP